jgi:hypothetical protein
VNKFKVIVGLLILGLGGAIYVLYRNHTLLYQLSNTVVGDYLVSIRRAMGPPSDFIVYNLPGCLWSIAYILIIDGLFVNLSFRTLAFISCVIPMAGVLSELLQAIHIIPGHYDSVDLILYLLPYLLFIGMRKICQTR